MPGGRRQKYGAVPKAGFASTGEHDRAHALRLQVLAGVISDLQLQVTVPLVPGISYRLDFVYVETATRRRVWEDWKGVKTPVFKLKAKLWKLVGPGLLRITSRHGIEDVESERRTLSSPRR